MKTSVFIVDDHYMVIEGIRSLLNNEANLEWAGHATSRASCLSFLQQYQPDVILMDINLGEESGIQLCKTVKELYPLVFVIGLSTFNQQSFIQKMLDHGASGYVLKNATRDEILEAIQTVVKGKMYVSDDASSTLKAGEQTEIILTRREKEVLELIANGMTNNEIAKTLFVSNTTVDTHRGNLLLKLQARNTAELVKLAVMKKLIAF